MRLIIISSIIILLASCNTNTKSSSLAIGDSLSLPKDSLTFYFPAATFYTTPHSDSFIQNWYASDLYNFKEPVLSQQYCGHNIYRFLWLRSFHRPVVFTLSQSNDRVWLTTKMLDREPEFQDQRVVYFSKEEQAEYTKEGYVADSTKPDMMIKYADRKATIVYYKRTALSTKEWNAFEQLLAKANFWMLPTRIDSGDSDGANWVIEAHLKNQYHVVSNHSPHDETYSNAGLYLIQLSGLQEEIY